MIPAKDIRHVQFPSLLRIVINETGSRAYVGPRDNLMAAASAADP